MNNSLIAIFWLFLCLDAIAHGRSEEMIRELSATVPGWMSLAEPIKVEPVEDKSLPASHSFRPRSGGATNSRNRVQVPERGIEFQVDYPIDYTGNNAAGRGVSLSPDGAKVIVNSGVVSHLYEIDPNGEHAEVQVMIPHVTYDEGVKGFITKWAWAGNDVLVGRAGITDETGHEIIEGRIYVFHMKEKALARLDLSALNLPDTAGIEVSSIGDDLEHLKLRIGDRELGVKADLKSPPRLIAREGQHAEPDAIRSKTDPHPRNPTLNLKDAAVSVFGPESSTPWSLIIVMIVAVVGLLWLLLKRRS